MLFLQVASLLLVMPFVLCASDLPTDSPTNLPKSDSPLKKSPSIKDIGKLIKRTSGQLAAGRCNSDSGKRFEEKGNCSPDAISKGLCSPREHNYDVSPSKGVGPRRGSTYRPSKLSPSHVLQSLLKGEAEKRKKKEEEYVLALECGLAEVDFLMYGGDLTGDIQLYTDADRCCTALEERKGEKSSETSPALGIVEDPTSVEKRKEEEKTNYYSCLLSKLRDCRDRLRKRGMGDCCDEEPRDFCKDQEYLLRSYKTVMQAMVAFDVNVLEPCVLGQGMSRPEEEVEKWFDMYESMFGRISRIVTEFMRIPESGLSDVRRLLFSTINHALSKGIKKGEEIERAVEKEVERKIEGAVEREIEKREKIEKNKGGFKKVKRRKESVGHHGDVLLSAIRHVFPRDGQETKERLEAESADYHRDLLLSAIKTVFSGDDQELKKCLKTFKSKESIGYHRGLLLSVVRKMFSEDDQELKECLETFERKGSIGYHRDVLLGVIRNVFPGKDQEQKGCLETLKMKGSSGYYRSLLLHEISQISCKDGEELRECLRTFRRLILQAASRELCMSNESPQEKLNKYIDLVLSTADWILEVHKKCLKTYEELEFTHDETEFTQMSKDLSQRIENLEHCNKLIRASGEKLKKSGYSDMGEHRKSEELLEYYNAFIFDEARRKLSEMENKKGVEHCDIVIFDVARQMVFDTIEKNKKQFRDGLTSLQQILKSIHIFREKRKKYRRGSRSLVELDQSRVPISFLSSFMIDKSHIDVTALREIIEHCEELWGALESLQNAFSSSAERKKVGLLKEALEALVHIEAAERSKVGSVKPMLEEAPIEVTECFKKEYGEEEEL